MEKVVRTSSTVETIELGRRLGELLRAGDVLVLTGDLGAGKTQLTKGIARGMGVEGDVTSPTFTIEMVYQGTDLELDHFDLYRLDDPDQLVGVTAGELFEWAWLIADVADWLENADTHTRADFDRFFDGYCSPDKTAWFLTHIAERIAALLDGDRGQP